MTRTLTLLIALWIPMSAGAAYTDGTCAGWGDVTCFQQDYLQLSSADRATIADYYTYMNGRQATITSTYGVGYSSLPQAYRVEFWARMIEAEANDGVLDVATPFDIDKNLKQEVTFTESEAIDSYAAKVAHAMWVHVNAKLPWDLDDITDSQLQYLIKPSVLFLGWNPGGSPAAKQYYFVDHSPSRTWDVAVTTGLGGLPFTGSQRDAWIAILGNIGTTFFHGTNQWPETIDQAMVTLATNTGCHSATRIMAALLRALNIPAYEDVGWLKGTGGHSSAFFPSIGAVLMHGDDIYAAGDYVPLELVTESMAWAEASLTRLDTSNDAKNQRRRAVRIWMPWFQAFYAAYFCAQGWDFIKTLLQVDTPQDQHWLDAWEQEFINRTGCDGAPQ